MRRQKRAREKKLSMKNGGIAMKKIVGSLVICLYAPVALAFTIATGPNGGSYFQIAQDIKNVAAKEGVELQVSSTKGSLENIQLLGRGKVDLAIVQLGVCLSNRIFF